MHRALTIQDFIQLVVNEVARPCPLEERTLLALALTCRAFQEAALDMLWAYQDGLGRLVQCLPEDLWTYSDDPLEDITLSEPTRATTQQDWQRFDVYARRVRTLDIDDSPYFKSRTECRVSGPLFRWLLSSRTSHQLLPSLSFLDLGWGRRYLPSITTLRTRYLARGSLSWTSAPLGSPTPVCLT
ncbi:uncharacterized protein B0H18DRAFT_526624 [Fomitopsis serialis]|uniref:uncharacterized protein n=1 Tax=Fomitopsis serialis TaxID=139415 RepID=UPI002008A1EA|nr:uncharacterized protein B0H18DRAFT_526624 [Neoantrodia serialis]KAH9922061.1 hypothetical protein B0H18DRAFT_526624 [Neoantrodia serialis]